MKELAFDSKSLFNHYNLSLLLILFLGTGCDYNEYPPDFDDVGTVQGYRPIYRAVEEIQDIKTLPPKSLQNPGKIYIYQNYLFINESGRGVHVINNINPADPQPHSFINIEGNVDISIKDNVLYADNYSDLVTLDLSNIDDIKVLKRIKGVFESQSMVLLPQGGVYFECPDKSKGVIVDWEEVELRNPKCYR